MPAEYIINEVIDVNGSIRDLDAVLKEINAFEKSIQQINSNPINIGGINSLKELREAATQLTQSLNQLNTTVSNLSKGNSGKVFQDQAKGIQESSKAVTEHTAAMQENAVAQKEGLKWTEFVGQRMGQYMKIYGTHAEAIKQISKEWAEYKATGQSVVQTSNAIASAQQKEIAGTSEKEQALISLNGKYEQASVLAKNLADQFGAESEQAKNAARTAAELKTQIDALNATQPAATTPNISAYEALKKETKEAEINAKNLAAQFGIDSKEALEAAASYEVLKNKLAEVNSVTKAKKAAPEPFDPNSVPFTNNSAEIEKQNKDLEKTGDVVNDLEKEYAAVTNEATALGNAQLEANASLGETAAVVPEIIGALDEYTGSLSTNITAQLENNSALAANRAEQKLIAAEIRNAGGATEKHTARLIALKQEELLLVDANRELSGTIKNQIRDFVSAEGSIDEMRAKLALLQRQYEQLSASEKKTGLGVSLKSQIDLLDPALKKAEESVGKAQRQVGSYGNAITKAFSGAFSYVRQLAYILPGIGIAGIIGAVSDTVVTLVTALIKGEDQTKKFAEAQKMLSDQLNISTTALKNQQQALKDDFALLIDSQKSINTIQEKAGENQYKAFANKKALAKEELDLSNNQLKSTISQAETDALNSGKRVQGINAVIVAQQIYRDKYRESIDEQKRLQDELYQHELTIKLAKERIDKNKDLSVSEIADIGKQIGKARKEIENNKTLTKSNEEVVKSYKDRYDLYTTTLKNTTDATTNYNALLAEEQKYSEDQRRQIAVEGAKIEANLIIAKNQIILSSEKSTLDQRLAAIRSNSAQQKAIAAADLYKVTSDPTKAGTADEVIAKKAYAAEILKINQKSNQEQFNENEKYRQRNIQADKQMFSEQKQLQIDQLRELVDSTEFSIQDRLSFQQLAIQAQKDIIDNEHKALLDSKKYVDLTADEKLSIEVDYETKLLQLTRSANEKITQIIKSELDKQQNLREEDFDRIQRLYQRLDLNSSDKYTADVIALNKSLKQKEISYTAYLKKRTELDYQNNQETLQNTIREIKNELELYKGAENSVIAIERNLLALREKLSNATTETEKKSILQSIDVEEKKYDIAKKNVDKKIALLKKLSQAEKDAADASRERDKNETASNNSKYEFILSGTREFISQMQSLYDQLSEARIQQFEIEKDALENRYQREIDLINQTYVNAVDRDKALAAAKARNAAAKKVLDDKEKQENIKKAKFDKEAAIFSIILNTAAAIVRDLGNPLKIAFDAAIGAAELAVAVAQPLPRYFRGKTKYDKYEGPAFVNDGGKKEAIVRKDGTVDIPEKMNTIEWVGKDDIVLPDANMLAWHATKSVAQTPFVQVTTTNTGLSREDFMYGINKLDNRLKNQPKTRQTNSKDALFKAWISSNKSWGDFFR